MLAYLHVCICQHGFNLNFYEELTFLRFIFCHFPSPKLLPILLKINGATILWNQINSWMIILLWLCALLNKFIFNYFNILNPFYYSLILFSTHHLLFTKSIILKVLINMPNLHPFLFYSNKSVNCKISISNPILYHCSYLSCSLIFLYF